MSSWRTTLTGAINVVIGAGVIAFAIFLMPAAQATLQAAIIALGLGLITAGAGLLAARDQAAHEPDAQALKSEVKREIRRDLPKL